MRFEEISLNRESGIRFLVTGEDLLEVASHCKDDDEQRANQSYKEQRHEEDCEDANDSVHSHV